MRKSWLIIILNFIAVGAIAQKVNKPNVVVQKTKGVKTQVVNGSPMAANLNIIQNVAKAKDYSILFNAIKVADLTETFESKGPITIFAPTNQAFEKLPRGKMDSLLKPVHKYELSSLLTYHAIPGKISSKDIAKNIREHKGTATFITLAGSKLAARIDDNRNIVLTDETGGQCVITQFDVEQSNGMLHVVNSVFVPRQRTI